MVAVVYQVTNFETNYKTLVRFLNRFINKPKPKSRIAPALFLDFICPVNN